MAEAVLLISRTGTRMIRWAEPFCRELAALGYRVIRFDNRDAGYSPSFAQHGAVDVEPLVSLLMPGSGQLCPTCLPTCPGMQSAHWMPRYLAGVSCWTVAGTNDCPRDGERAPVPSSVVHLDHVSSGHEPGAALVIRLALCEPRDERAAGAVITGCSDSCP